LRSAWPSAPIPLYLVPLISSLVYRKAEDVVWFLDRPAVQKKFNLQKGISLATARRWMKNMNYRWKKNSKGETCFSAHLAKAK
jgi:exonuclease V gamma subunit